ncbi:FxsA family protein [Symbioplanes lichenis]|uniref:FxsA family protein n=1 Tax=Symbioplanes lichenis TaxID=1629072 RepID=UPI002739BD73|nr:FxsA family protein [Actinoplanes lichenis]
MRRGLALLPVALLALAVIEITVFVGVVHALGGFWAILLLLATSITGLALLRREGIKGWRAFRDAAQAGRPPGAQVSNSLVGLAGALLLAIPGFVSAVLGLLLVLPPGRLLARRGVARYTERRVGSAVAGDLFGPRHVRVHQADPVDDPAPGTPGPATRAPAGEITPGEVVEGEIIR